MTRRSFGTINGTLDIKLAARSGMSFLSVSCMIGFAILFYGQQQQAAGNSPELVNGSGVLKFPHGIAIHAIQLFPLTCWFFSLVGVIERERFTCVAWATISMGTLLLFSGVQTVGGRGRFDLTPASGTVLVIAILLLFPIISIVFSTLARRIRQPGQV